MAGQSLEQRKAAVQSMFRVRVAESPPGPDGMREVWHQGGDGADLTTVVDPQGRVSRLEFTLFDDFLSWTAEAGASTGQVDASKAAGGMKGSDVVARDLAIDASRVARMNDALQGYSGADKYLGHLRTVVGNLHAGLVAFSTDEVTSTLTAPSRTAPKAPTEPAPASGGKTLLYVGLGLAALVVVGLVVALVR